MTAATEGQGRPAPARKAGQTLARWRGRLHEERERWPFWLALALAVTGAAFGLRAGLTQLHANWTGSFTYSHGYLILALSLWLFVTRLRGRPLAELAPSPAGVGLLAGAAVAYALAELLDVTVGIQAMLPVLLLGLLAALGGIVLARRAAVPVAYLYFAIPLWDLLDRPLQELTTLAVTSALPLSNIVAYVEGNIVETPAGRFEIAGGCSGLHFFIVGLALASFYGLSWHRRWRTRLALLAVTGLAATVANWIRVYTLIAVGDASNMEHYLIAEDHYVFGWVLFALAMAPVLYVARWLELRETGGDTATPGPGVVGKAGPAPARCLLAGTLAAGMLAAPALMHVGATVPESPRAIELAGHMPPEWRRVAPDESWRPHYRRPHELAHEGYRSPAGAPVELYLARYERQQSGSKLSFYNNSLEEGWQRSASRMRTVTLGGESGRVRELELLRAGERRLVWYWYDVAGAAAHDRLRARLLEVPALLRGRRDAAVVAVSAPCGTGCETARATMEALLANAGPALEAAAGGRLEGAR